MIYSSYIPNPYRLVGEVTSYVFDALNIKHDVATLVTFPDSVEPDTLEVIERIATKNVNRILLERYLVELLTTPLGVPHQHVILAVEDTFGEYYTAPVDYYANLIKLFGPK